MKSSIQSQFSQIPQAKIPRSVFRRDHGHKTTFNAGYLIPFLVEEILPGDTFHVKTTIFARLTTPKLPFMDNIWLDTFYFYVPNRLIWDNFKRFMGEQTNPGDSIDYLVPQLGSGEGWPTHSIMDYMGLPVGIPNLSVNVLPMRAYNLVYNDWFRDENLIDSATVNKGDGPDGGGYYTLRKRGKRHDYFTSCLPWPQKFIDGVPIPIGNSAPVFGTGKALGFYHPTDSNPYNYGSFGLSAYSNIALNLDQGAYGVDFGSGFTSNNDGAEPGRAVGVITKDKMLSTEYNNTGLFADLSLATSATVNSLRQAFALQKLVERDARGGSRYIEIVRSHFGVINPDFRLQRPEYLGGSTERVTVMPVQQTSSTDNTTPQGHLAAYGVVSSNSGGFSKSFTEHGYVIGILCARADLSYQKGLHRMWTRKKRYDFYWPELAMIGEQTVLNEEIYCQNGSDPSIEDPYNKRVFGYIPRYDEYRYSPSKITGLMRSSVSPGNTSIHQWHLSQNFTNLPALNQQFIEEDVPIDRVVAVTSEPHFFMDSIIEMTCARPMPTFGVPGLIDHF